MNGFPWDFFVLIIFIAIATQVWIYRSQVARIKAFASSQGWSNVEVAHAPASQRPLFDRYNRYYQVTYQDGSGLVQKRLCKVSWNEISWP